MGKAIEVDRADRLARNAAGVLLRNGFEDRTRPAPALYPHQWSWDSALIALGLARMDNHRAARELESLFAGQWTTGKVPHIVFNPEAPPRSYFPDAERWSSATLCSDAPAEPHTSALCQPPVHAIAVRRIWETSQHKDKRSIEFARSCALATRASLPGTGIWRRPEIQRAQGL